MLNIISNLFIEKHPKRIKNLIMGDLLDSRTFNYFFKEDLTEVSISLFSPKMLKVISIFEVKKTRLIELESENGYRFYSTALNNRKIINGIRP